MNKTEQHYGIILDQPVIMISAIGLGHPYLIFGVTESVLLQKPVCLVMCYDCNLCIYNMISCLSVITERRLSPGEKVTIAVFVLLAAAGVICLIVNRRNNYKRQKRNGEYNLQLIQQYEI